MSILIGFHSCNGKRLTIEQSWCHWKIRSAAGCFLSNSNKKYPREQERNNCLVQDDVFISTSSIYSHLHRHSDDLLMSEDEFVFCLYTSDVCVCAHLMISWTMHVQLRSTIRDDQQIPRDIIIMGLYRTAKNDYWIYFLRVDDQFDLLSILQTWTRSLWFAIVNQLLSLFLTVKSHRNQRFVRISQVDKPPQRTKKELWRSRWWTSRSISDGLRKMFQGNMSTSSSTQ